MVRQVIQKSKSSTNTYHNCEGDDIYLKIEKQSSNINVIITKNPRLWPIRSFLMFLVPFLCYYLNYIETGLIVIAIFIWNYISQIQEESLSMIDGLGYNVTTKYVIGEKNLFIPNNQVQSVFINEVVYRWKVLFVLTIFTKDECSEKLIPLFWEIRPRLDCLEIIYKHLKRIKR